MQKHVYSFLLKGLKIDGWFDRHGWNFVNGFSNADLPNKFAQGGFCAMSKIWAFDPPFIWIETLNKGKENHKEVHNNQQDIYKFNPMKYMN